VSFEYLVEWDPDRFPSSTYREMPLVQDSIEHSEDLTRFGIYSSFKRMAVERQ